MDIDKQSIQDYVMTVFDKKPQAKRAQWIGLLNGEGYDTVGELRGASEEAWEGLGRKLPGMVVDTLKKNLRPIKEVDQKQDLSSIKNKNQDPYISPQDLTKITQLLTLDIPTQKILTLLDTPIATPRGQSILATITSLLKPAKPFPPPPVKQLPPLNSKDPVLPLFLYESKKIDGRKYYTFLVIGETGSGKTTLLDGFVNKLTGMEFGDNWRWKLVDQSHLDGEESKKSKTSNINHYYINDCLNQFNMLVIDTPGFGDTRGLTADNQITKMFQTFFHEIESIDYILLTVKSSDTRELGGSLYVYDRIQQLFGKNAADRFIVMCTFADDKTPKCLEVIKGTIMYEKYFAFNNSALFTPSDMATSMTKSYWKMGMNSIQEFSKYIQQKNALPLSLTQSTEVLQLRNFLLQSIKTSEEQLVESWRLLQISRKNYQQIKINKAKIQQNGQFTRKTLKTQLKRTPLKNHYQLCQNCQVTCCQKCIWPPQAKQSKCSYFYFNLFGCPKCPGRCPRSAHVRSNQLVVKVTVEVQEVISYKKELYDSGLTATQYYIRLLEESYGRVRQLSKNVWNNSLRIKQDLKKLEEIALKPKMFTNQQFYRKMLMQEQQSKKEGWVERSQILRQIIKRISFLDQVDKSIQMQDLFPGLQQMQVNYQKVSKRDASSQCQIF